MREFDADLMRPNMKVAALQNVQQCRHILPEEMEESWANRTFGSAKSQVDCASLSSDLSPCQIEGELNTPCSGQRYQPQALNSAGGVGGAAKSLWGCESEALPRGGQQFCGGEDCPERDVWPPAAAEAVLHRGDQGQGGHQTWQGCEGDMHW